jgi:hypothetical protein
MDDIRGIAVGLSVLNPEKVLELGTPKYRNLLLFAKKLLRTNETQVHPRTQLLPHDAGRS